MSKKTGAALPKDVPWRASQGKPIPKIHHSHVLRVSQNPFSNYALFVMRDPNPVEHGLAVDAILEAAGPECIVPGQATPVKLLGLKVWPIEVDFKFLEPVGRELNNIGKKEKESASEREQRQDDAGDDDGGGGRVGERKRDEATGVAGWSWVAVAAGCPLIGRFHHH